MKHQDLRMLVQWMEVADIAAVEMSTPRFSVRLVRRRPAASVGAAGPEVSDSGARPCAVVHVTAEVPGAFMAAHPLRGQPLAGCGTQVAAGDVLGLIVVGETFYLPILAPRKGRVLRRLVADGQPIEAGAALFEFEPAAHASA